MSKKKPAAQPVDDFDVEVPTAMPSVKAHVVNDAFPYDVAASFAFIGVGQGGGRLAETFYDLGYRRVCAVNTDHADLATLNDDIPKLDLQTGGAGKDLEQGETAARNARPAIYDLMTRSFGKDVDYVLVCAGLGGGTGSGAGPETFRIAQQYMQEHEKSPERVGAIVTLPHSAEGQTSCRNAVKAFSRLHGLRPSPLLIVDNKRIGEIYQRGVTEFFPTANEQIAKLLHLFNRLGAQKSTITTFDRADLASLLDNGICVLGASAVPQTDSPADFSQAATSHMAGSILAEVDVSGSDKVGCLYVGSEEALSQIPMDFFDGGFQALTRITKGGTLHRGIYVSGGSQLRCFTLLSGLPAPEATLRRLADVGQMSGGDADGILQHLGL